MGLLSKLFVKKDKASDDDVRYIVLGSPNHPNNPLNGVPARPFTTAMVDSDGRSIDESWCREKWKQQSSASVFVADALDETIIASATLQAVSLKKQMIDDHAGVITRLRNAEPTYFREELQNKMEDHLKNLEEVKHRLKHLPE